MVDALCARESRGLAVDYKARRTDFERPLFFAEEVGASSRWGGDPKAASRFRFGVRWFLRAWRSEWLLGCKNRRLRLFWPFTILNVWVRFMNLQASDRDRTLMSRGGFTCFFLAWIFRGREVCPPCWPFRVLMIMARKRFFRNNGKQLWDRVLVVLQWAQYSCVLVC